ncbi:MAG: hypothetical protein JWQ87_2362 [Candidatus Sulfotelmatobacter sp.]|nr:hypothetical protein [Candidatus Sulfotelmatobacter sp.]
MQRLLDAPKLVKLLPVLAIFMASEIGACQQASTPLLRLQESRAYLNIDANVQHGQGMWGITFGNPGDVWRYPNSLSCLVVYGDGKYVLEKRDEPTLGKPKVKRAEGSLGADDLLRLKGILDDEALKKIKTPNMPGLPDDAQAVRDIESLDAQIDHSGTTQRFTLVKERVKTGALTSATTGPSTGMDTYLDNGAPYKKTLSPLLKWFEGVEKKSKSELKESKPQYCAPINIG